MAVSLVSAARSAIATGRLHARGPVGVEELTTYKNIVRGTGQGPPGIGSFATAKVVNEYANIERYYASHIEYSCILWGYQLVF